VTLTSSLFGIGYDPDTLLKMDGYDDCIIGVVERFGQEPILCYDRDKVLLKLTHDCGDDDEALEFFYFNQLGSWVGDLTPCFITRLADD